jgi:anti-sigma-K factor RskA
LALYALGTLNDEERAAVEAHLPECSACRRELEELRSGVVALALSVSGPKPPARSREQLITAIAAEPRRAAMRPAARGIWWRPLQWAVAAGTVIVVALLALQNGVLKRQVNLLQAGASAQRQKLEQAEDFLNSLTSPDAERFTFVASPSPPRPLGRVIYVRRRGTLVFMAAGMAPLPLQQTYELWLIPKAGTPIPAGLFRPDAHGYATVLEPPLPAGTEAQTFAITIEPAGGSPAPTSKPVMVSTPG